MYYCHYFGVTFIYHHLSTTCDYHCLYTMFVYRYFDAVFIYIKMIQTNKVYMIIKKNQIKNCQYAIELES